MEWCWDSPPGFAAAVGAQDTGYCLKPGDGCSRPRSTCSMTVDCACSDCNDSAACGGPGPSPMPDNCSECVAGGKEWCSSTGMCGVISSTLCSKALATCSDNAECSCSNCANTACQSPTPPPTPRAQTCEACVALDNMQWCWKGLNGQGQVEPGCFRPGDFTSGCTESTATCSNPVDCHCSACDDSAKCGGPNPQSWTGTASTFTYTHGSTCAKDQQSPKGQAAWITTSIFRMPTDPLSSCSTTKVTSGMGYLYYKETCGTTGTMSNNPTVTRTLCHTDSTCTSCDDSSAVTYAVEYTDTGACATATGMSHVSQLSYELERSSVTTTGGSISIAHPKCLVPPHSFPTPSPAGGGGGDKAGVGVGLGLGIPAVAGGLWFFQKKKREGGGSFTMPTGFSMPSNPFAKGTAQQALTTTGNTGAQSMDPALYSQL